jgi:glycosyltransferase involved in cell wall biosynthesis
LIAVSAFAAVDVIIPVRNRAYLISACLDSVHAQTLRPHAVIVVDDGSNDATPQIIEAYAARWPALRLIRSVSRGVSHARNIGLGASRSPFVAFLDSDDIWLPEKLERQMALFASASVQTGFVHCACFRISDWESSSQTSQEFWPTRRGNIFRDILENFYHVVGSASAVVARRDLIERVGGFDETLLCGEDLDLWLRLARISHIDYVAAALVGLRAHRGSTFSQAVRNNPEFVLFQRLKIWSRWAGEIADERTVLARFHSEAIQVSMANMLRRDPRFGLYGRLKQSDFTLARRLFSGPADYLQLGRRLRIAYRRAKHFVASRLILPNAKLLRLCQVLGRLKQGVQAVDYNETLHH